MDANYWIKHLDLQKHPEGGYFKETYRCSDTIIAPSTNNRRNISTAIYFLLEGEDKSHFHKIQSDELWFFHEGRSLEIFILTATGLQTITLGKNLEAGESFQAVIPAGVWFGSRVKNGSGFSLVSCTVAPGFDFQDFEMATKETLLNSFPKLEKIIDEMTL